MYKLGMEYLKRGWSFYPCGKNKIPLIKSWKEYQVRYPTEREIIEWFTKFPDAQIAVVTGRLSNISVVDVEKGGDPSFLPQDTRIVSSGGGGYHYYYEYNSNAVTKTKVKDLVDVKSDGGCIMGSGSCSEKGPYTTLQELPLLPFPIELFPVPNILKSPTYGEYKSSGKVLTPYPGYGPGQRNDMMTKYIGYVLTQIPPQNWDTEAWGIIQEANSCNTPPLSLYEARSAFESIKRIEGTAYPFGRLKQAPSASFSPTVSNTDSEPTILDDESDEIKPLSTVAEEQVLDQNDVYPLQMKCFDDVIYGGVAPGDLITVGGQTGHGKTTLTQDWTLSLIRGEKKPKSLWFSYEVLPTHLWKKFQEMGMTKEECVFIPCKHTTGNVAWVEEKIKEGKEKFGTKIIFIDHLGFLLPKTNGVLGVSKISSNYSSFLTQIVRDLKTIAIREQVIIFIPVHVRKPEKGKRSDVDDIKDSSGIGQEADLVFLIEREKNKDPNATSYFTDNTYITLAKNRKTGITVVGRFNMLKGRFAYNDPEAKAESDFENLGLALEDHGARADIPPAPMNFPYKDIPEEKEEENWEKVLEEFNSVNQ